MQIEEPSKSEDPISDYLKVWRPFIGNSFISWPQKSPSVVITIPQKNEGTQAISANVLNAVISINHAKSKTVLYFKVLTPYEKPAINSE